MAATREKRRAAGLKAYEVWLHPLDWPLVKRYIAKLAKRRRP